jgi:hypothetical protein
LSTFRFSRPVRRNRHGSVSVNLPPGERQVLRQLPAELKALLARPDDPALRRLFPPAYTDDDEATAEYRRLMQDDLLQHHAAALDTLSTTADRTELSDEEATAWMQALNQIPLVLGTRLDVTEDDDPRDVRSPEHRLYFYLGYLQEHVVEALADG